MNFQHEADKAAELTPEQKKVNGENIAKVVDVVQQLLGGDAYRAGSDKKATDIAESDIDLLVTTKAPVTQELRQILAQALAGKFPDGEVHKLRYFVRIIPDTRSSIQVKAKDIDVVFQLFDERGVKKEMPDNYFKNNPDARNAIRVAKKSFAHAGYKVKGVQIEDAVINFMNENANCTGQMILQHLLTDSENLFVDKVPLR